MVVSLGRSSSLAVLCEGIQAFDDLKPIPSGHNLRFCDYGVNIE